MKAYEGKDKYIFVSYSHNDSDSVIPVIQALDKLGFRIWYDTGIEAGTEWPAYIEEHLNLSEVVLVFMSPSAVASINCRNEINYAASIKKEMLVVYLEETKLAQGMSLQLSSLQSMFKFRHESLNSFIEELSKAKILQSCRYDISSTDSSEPQPKADTPNYQTSNTSPAYDFERAQNSGNRKLIKQSRENGPSLIANVGTKPSNDPNTPWPKTEYTQIINIDTFRVVHFHCNLVKPVTKEENKTIGLQIFNQEDALIYEHFAPLYFKQGYDRFSKCWIVRSDDGMPMNPGIYTALLWIDNSRAVEYKIKLISKKDQVVNPPVETVNNLANDNKNIKIDTKENEAKKELALLTEKLRYPKIFVLSLISQILLWTSMIMYGNYVGDDIEFIFMILFFIASIALLIPIFIMSKNNVFHRWWLALIVVFIGCGYYHVYLTVMLIITLVNKKKWLKRIEELKKNNM